MLALWKDPFFSEFMAPYTRGQEVYKSDQDYEVHVEVPGFKPEDIEVTYHDRTLEISAKREGATLRRAYTVPTTIDTESISARAEHGLLTVKLPSKPEHKPRKIKVQG